MSFLGVYSLCVVEVFNCVGLIYLLSCLQLHSFSSMEGALYCKPHFEQLFKETGNFNKSFQSRMNSSFLNRILRFLYFLGNELTI